MAQVDEIKAKITAAGVEAHFFNINATDANKRAEVVSHLQELGATVKILMHSLAFGALKSYLGEDPVNQSQMELTLDVMANSLVYWTQDLFKAGLLAEGSQIYGLTSAGSQKVWLSYGPVSAAKAALESHIRQLAVELAPHKIAVNALCPGSTETPAAAKIPNWESIRKQSLEHNPHGRLTKPEDVAEWIAVFSRTQSSWMTGNVIRLDGGELLVS
jgi:NAD(P)-dependent dehydrogenase (short-subunit alcohol dehydrogenase family)